MVEKFAEVASLRELLYTGSGDAPLRLVRARWLLEHFQAAGNEKERLGSRRELEKAYGDAPYACGAMLDRILAELASSQYAGARREGWATAQKRKPLPVPIAFPSAAAISYMHLDASHPDPNGRCLRELWLPFVEWYYSERVRQLLHCAEIEGREARVEDEAGELLSDDAVRSSADFGIFIDHASVVGAADDAALRKQGLDGLGVIFSHPAIASLLSTRAPAGAAVDGGFEDRGWCAPLLDSLGVAAPLTSQARHRRCTFERLLATLMKRPEVILDLGRFTIDMACIGPPRALRIGGKPFADRSVSELAKQGSYIDPQEAGVRGTLSVTGRCAPLSPESFDALLESKRFSISADVATVAQLYREVVIAYLGSAKKLAFEQLEWSSEDYSDLGKALRHCGALETLILDCMGMQEADMAAAFKGLSLPTLTTLEVKVCTSLLSLADLSAFTTLRTLYVGRCTSLIALSNLSALTALQMIDLSGCSQLKSLPSLKAQCPARKATHSRADTGCSVCV